ncbi:MAG: DUF3810 domain-containing protein [Ruminiclostridium sp.]|nr:DUF3810 domain-containing protein [Ruminiclostridium sp.]
MIPREARFGIMRKESIVPKKRLIIAAAFLVPAIGGLVAAYYADGFADFYGFNIYPTVVNIFARISGIFPFSVAEIMVIAGVLLALFSIVYFIVGMIRRKGRRGRFLLSSVSSVLLVGSILLFEFTYGMGINYNRKPFSEIAGLKTGKYTKAQVLEVLEYTIANLTEAGKYIELDEEGHIVAPDDLSARAVAAMRKMGEQYQSLDSYYAGVKPVMLSELMCYGHITGMFTFYSMEANYNTMNNTEELGHLACHELSHMTGFMREDEANFIAYLACRESGDPFLTYSGWYAITIYMLNAYYPDASPEEYRAVYSTIPDYAIKQLVMQNELWDRYETDFGEVAETMNDVYLKINHQSDGTKSYGRVADLTIADYYSKKS